MRSRLETKPLVRKGNPLLFTIPFIIGLVFIALIVFYLITELLLPGVGGHCVAVMTINIPLVAEGVPSSLISGGIPGSDQISEKIKKVDKRTDVGAMIIVVNTGGGSVVASREIYSAMVEFSKPKVAYFREVAASGGYYISSPSDYIISEPYAITGSIGVISTFTDMSGLFGKVGINITNIATGDHKAMGSQNKPLDEEELKIIQEITSEVFEDFKGVILENRGSKLNMEKFEEILDGRIFTGNKAKEIGLVDDVGNKQDAINKAAELAGIEGEPSICEIDMSVAQEGLFDVSAFLTWIGMENNNMNLNYK